MSKANNNPKILYVISALSSQGKGVGGHYHSLLVVAEALNAALPEKSVAILVLGDIPSPVFKDTPVKVFFVPFEKSRPFLYSRRIMEAVQDFYPTHVHAFDNKSYFFARLIAKRYKSKRFLTRPGGPNPNNFFPYCEDLFLFSEEGLNHFKSDKKFSSAKLHLIPNRVAPVRADLARIEQLKKKHGITGSVILRIARMGSFYSKSLEQTLKLAKQARDNGSDVRALLLGVVEEGEEVERLRAIAGDIDIIENDSVFTTHASELIPVADYVVGTGRSLMEAATFGLPLFVPATAYDLPVPVTEENWEELARHNFSERSIVSGLADTKASKLSLGIFADPKEKDTAEKVSSGIISPAYSVTSAVPKYLGIYDNEQPKKLSPVKELVDTVLNFLTVVFYYIRLYA